MEGALPGVLLSVRADVGMASKWPATAFGPLRGLVVVAALTILQGCTAPPPQP